MCAIICMSWIKESRSYVHRYIYIYILSVHGWTWRSGCQTFNPFCTTLLLLFFFFYEFNGQWKVVTFPLCAELPYHLWYFLHWLRLSLFGIVCIKKSSKTCKLSYPFLLNNNISQKTDVADKTDKSQLSRLNVMSRRGRLQLTGWLLVLFCCSITFRIIQALQHTKLTMLILTLGRKGR